jgi:hypothetical protein
VPVLALWQKPRRANDNLVAWCEILQLLAHCVEAVYERLLNMLNKVICGRFQPVPLLAL